ncbi:hypothetical protein CRENBAI_024545, partial [Crenichthys baileyi]
NVTIGTSHQDQVDTVMELKQWVQQQQEALQALYGEEVELTPSPFLLEKMEECFALQPSSSSSGRALPAHSSFTGATHTYNVGVGEPSPIQTWMAEPSTLQVSSRRCDLLFRRGFGQCTQFFRFLAEGWLDAPAPLSTGGPFDPLLIAVKAAQSLKDPAINQSEPQPATPGSSEPQPAAAGLPRHVPEEPQRPGLEGVYLELTSDATPNSKRGDTMPPIPVSEFQEGFYGEPPLTLVPEFREGFNGEPPLTLVPEFPGGGFEDEPPLLSVPEGFGDEPPLTLVPGLTDCAPGPTDCSPGPADWVPGSTDFAPVPADWVPVPTDFTTGLTDFLPKALDSKPDSRPVTPQPDTPQPDTPQPDMKPDTRPNPLWALPGSKPLRVLPGSKPDARPKSPPRFWLRSRPPRTSLHLQRSRFMGSSGLATSLLTACIFATGLLTACIFAADLLVARIFAADHLDAYFFAAGLQIFSFFATGFLDFYRHQQSGIWRTFAVSLCRALRGAENSSTYREYLGLVATTLIRSCQNTEMEHNRCVTTQPTDSTTLDENC